MMADDEAFRQTLRGLSDTFYHKIISTADVENYISRRAARNLTPFFDQYLRTAQIPVLEWNRKGGKLYYRFGNTVPGFTLPIPVEGRNSQTLEVSTEWSSIAWKGKAPRFAADFLIQTRETKTSN
jgi:aminopeptidase N